MALIKLAHTLKELPSHTLPDLVWVSNNWTTLLNQYGEVSILVYEKQIIGVGDTYDEAMANAQQYLPDNSADITVVYQWLYE